MLSPVRATEMDRDNHSGEPQGERMLAWAKELFPVCRSITGDGQRQTIDFITQRQPAVQTHVFRTGERVFDWTIPREWNIRDAWIEHESGRRFAEFCKSNLHVLNYSAPVDTELSLDELRPHIWTQPDQPERIPYVTSYYAERWGFCMSENELRSLPSGRYRAVVDSTLTDGEMQLAELVVEGEAADEILFSTYICHPSMANNELSGPVLALALADYVKSLPNRMYSYRFLFVPETIGSIAYLSRNLTQMKAATMAGFVLSCVGDERGWSHVSSRSGTTMADRALRAAFIGLSAAKEYSFLERGSDERQYCAPGIDLPVCGFCRSKYAEFPEYHTDADNFDLVTARGLQGSYDLMRSVIDALETGPVLRNTVLGEPQLGPRGLYPTIGRKGGYGEVEARMNLLAYCDGRTDLFDVALQTGISLATAVAEARLLCEHDLLEVVGQE